MFESGPNFGNWEIFFPNIPYAQLPKALNKYEAPIALRFPVQPSPQFPRCTPLTNLLGPENI